MNTPCLTAALIVSIALAACGGGDEGGAEPTREPEPSLSAPAQGLLDLLEEGLQVTFRATYETVLPEGDEGDRFIVAQDPPRTKVEAITPDGDSILIVDRGGAEGTTGCSGGPDTWRCDPIEPLGDSLVAAAGPIPYQAARDLTARDVSEVAQRTVAGETVRCYRLGPTETFEEAEYCLTEDGVPLFATGQFGRVEATDFSRAVSGADFELPE